MKFDFANSILKQASTVILGIPYDRTSSFVPGTRFGPSYARIGSCNIESYSPYFNQDLNTVKIYDAGDLVLKYNSVKRTFTQIQHIISNYLKSSKQVLSIGGEHTVTIPIIKEFVKLYPNLYLIQLDAHSDTRDELMGDQYSHATVINHLKEILPVSNIFQLGLRSITKAAENKNQLLFSVFKYLDRLKNKIGNNPCYLTLDIDVLDCGIFPSVQTPVPNGISYQELFESIVKLSEFNIVGCDLVEYNPLISGNLTYASVVAEIIRELIFMMHMSQNFSK